MDSYADLNLVFFLKGIKVLFLDGRFEVVHHPQWKKNELPKAIKTYDGLGGGFSIDYALIIWVTH